MSILAGQNRPLVFLSTAGWLLLAAKLRIPSSSLTASPYIMMEMMKPTTNIITPAFMGNILIAA